VQGAAIHERRDYEEKTNAVTPEILAEVDALAGLLEEQIDTV
jgi:hypothetical protein